MALKRGRPKRWSFCGLFLPSLAWELGIEEVPMREFEEHATAGTFFRNARRAVDDAELQKTIETADAIFRRMPPSDVRDDLLAAIAGDQAARQRVATAGPWSVFLAGSGVSPPLYLAKEFARIEALCVGADQALVLGDFRGAAQELAKQPGAAAYWRHGSLDSLAAETTLERSLVPRLVAYLELQMSCIARASLVERRPTPRSGDPVHQLIAAGRRPGAQFMLHLMDLACAGTQAELLNVAAGHLAEGEQLPSEATIKRWCSGALFPPAKRIRPLALAVARAAKGGSTEADLRLMFWCARRANAAMSLADLLHERCVAPNLLASEDAPSWAEAAYAHWAARWRDASASAPVRAA